MKQFLALLRLQLLSRYADLKPRNLKVQLKEKKGRTVGKLLGVLVLVGYLGAMLYIVETKVLDVLLAMNMPDLLISMVTVLATAGTVIMSFFFVLSSLYLGRDSTYLAALPLKSRTVLSAKTVQVWISETCINAVLMLPACILYGVRTGASADFYLRMALAWLLIALLPICLIAFLSTLLIRISVLWRHREILLTVSGIALLVIYMFVMMNLGGVTGNAASGGEMLESFIRSNQARIRAMSGLFPPAAWAAEGILGQNYGMFALWILLSLAMPVLTVWLLSFSYRSLSLLQSETPDSGRKKRTGKESYAAGSQLKACCIRELKVILRVPSYATNILPVCFMPLLMIVMMSVILGRSGGETGESIAQIFEQLPSALIMCVLTAVMAYMGGMNPALSTAVSREGKGHGFLTALPMPPMTSIRAKMITGFGLSLAGLLAASAVLVIMFPALAVHTALAFILCVLFSYMTSALALSRDIRKPRLDWVTEQEAVKQNFGVLISLLISWGVLAVLAVLCYFLITWGWEMLPVFAALAGILGILCVAAHIHLVKTAEKYYCLG